MTNVGIIISNFLKTHAGSLFILAFLGVIIKYIYDNQEQIKDRIQQQ